MAQDDTEKTNVSGKRVRVVAQKVWGGALILAGLGVFYRIPDVMRQVVNIEQFSSNSWIIRFSFYILGVLLIGGGAKKIYDNFHRKESSRIDN